MYVAIHPKDNPSDELEVITRELADELQQRLIDLYTCANTVTELEQTLLEVYDGCVDEGDSLELRIYQISPPRLEPKNAGCFIINGPEPEVSPEDFGASRCSCGCKELTIHKFVRDGLQYRVECDECGRSATFEDSEEKACTAWDNMLVG